MKVTFMTKIATCISLAAVTTAGLVTMPAFADPVATSNTALVGVGSDTTMDVMDEIATAIGGGKLASYKSTGTQTIQTRSYDGAPTNVLRAKGSGDGWKMLQVAEGATTSLSTVATMSTSNQTANKANTVGQIDYARASSKQGTASTTGEFVNIPFAIDSVALAVNPTDAVAKIPFTGVGANTDSATMPTLKSVFQCKAKYVYLNNVTIGDVSTTDGSSTLTLAGHGLVVGDTFTVSSSAGGFSAGTKYYVKTVPTSGTFTASTSKGGLAISASADATLAVTKTSGTYNSVGASSGDAPAGTTAFAISPLIPAYGSGTASYFLGKVGQTESSGFPAAGDATQNCISRKFLDGSTNIQEHDGAAVAERENAIGIYSIGQWTSQTNYATTGATNKTNGVVLLDMFPVSGQIAATTGSGASLAPNENWDANLKRVVYNIVAYRKAVDPNSAIHEMFVGTNSLVCQQTYSIRKMGFTPLSSTDPNNVNSCGSIADGNRTTAGSDGQAVTGASITNISATTTDIGDAVTALVKVGTSNHQMGGRVIVTDNAVYGAAGAHILGYVDVAAGVAGDAQTEISITPTSAGTVALYAYFVPALGGIKVTALAADGTASVWTNNITVTTPSSLALSIKKPAKIGGTVRVVAVVTSDLAPGGTITLKDASNDATIATDALDEDETAGVITFTQTKANASVYATFTPNGSAVTGSTSSTRSWSLTKLTPSMSVAIGAAPSGLVAGVSPVFAVASKNLVRAATVNASTDVITLAAHGLVAGDQVTFASSTTAPAPATKVATYYVIASGLTAGAFKVSATLGGAAVNFTAAGSTVKVTSQNVAPKFTLTMAATDTSVTLKPTGSSSNIHVFYGSTSNARTTEITSTVSVSSGVATITLDRASLYAATGTLTTTAVTKYLTFVYDGDDAFNSTAFLSKAVQFKLQ
jgi:hypothetical protein